MAIQKQMLGVKGDECICGRRATIRHCPSCGSTRVYARSNRAHTFTDGSIKFVDVEFRCQSCGHLFVDEERQFCEAPPVGQKLAAQKVRALHEAQQAGEYLRPADQKLAEAIMELKHQEDQVVYDENALKNIWFSYKRAWADLKIENKTKGKESPTLFDFLKDGLTHSELPLRYVEQILDWQLKEDALKDSQQ